MILIIIIIIMILILLMTIQILIIMDLDKYKDINILNDNKYTILLNIIQILNIDTTK